jgi:hypothetical protein
MRDERERVQIGRWIATLLAGMLAGSVILTPVGAHITSFNHLKTKHFYSKKAADDRFVNVGEAASSAETAASAATAANADKVDGKNASDLVAAGVFVQNVGGNLAIHRWFNNVNGQPPTLSLIDPGYYAVNFGFDARSRYAVCSIDPNLSPSRNATCAAGTRWFDAAPNSNIEVALTDPQDGPGAYEFNLLVF